jgi:hypothetical protein
MYLLGSTDSLDSLSNGGRRSHHGARILVTIDAATNPTTAQAWIVMSQSSSIVDHARWKYNLCSKSKSGRSGWSIGNHCHQSLERALAVHYER